MVKTDFHIYSQTKLPVKSSWITVAWLEKRANIMLYFDASKNILVSCELLQYTNLLWEPQSILIKYNTMEIPKIDNMINFYFYVSTIL